MTDNEIIKALEHCTAGGKGCNGCPLNDMPMDCIKSLVGCALGLIKRQQARIAELHEINEGLAMSLLCDVINKDPDLRKEIVAAAEYNAITEFAERLKDYLNSDRFYDRVLKCLFDDIDNLVKEMTEANDE